MAATPHPPHLTALVEQAQRQLGPLPLDAAVDILAEHLRCSSTAGETTGAPAQTRRAIREATAWAALGGSTTVEDAAPHLERWISSPDLDRAGRVRPPSIATQHRRRTRVRTMYALLRRSGRRVAVGSNSQPGDSPVRLN